MWRMLFIAPRPNMCLHVFLLRAQVHRAFGSNDGDICMKPTKVIWIKHVPKEYDYLSERYLRRLVSERLTLIIHENPEISREAMNRAA